MPSAVGRLAAQVRQVLSLLDEAALHVDEAGEVVVAIRALHGRAVGDDAGGEEMGAARRDVVRAEKELTHAHRRLTAARESLTRYLEEISPSASNGPLSKPHGEELIATPRSGLGGLVRSLSRQGDDVQDATSMGHQIFDQLKPQHITDPEFLRPTIVQPASPSGPAPPERGHVDTDPLTAVVFSTVVLLEVSRAGVARVLRSIRKEQQEDD